MKTPAQLLEDGAAVRETARLQAKLDARTLHDRASILFASVGHHARSLRAAAGKLRGAESLAATSIKSHALRAAEHLDQIETDLASLLEDDSDSGDE